MNRPAFFRCAPNKSLFLFLGVAALAFTPQIVSAQHGGGHTGGGMGGGGHFSSPPAPHYSPAPAPHYSPPPPAPAPHFSPPPQATNTPHVVTPPAAYVPPRVPPPAAYVPPPPAPAGNAVVHPAPAMNTPEAPGNLPRASGFVAAPVAGSVANPGSNPATSTPAQLFSTTPDAMRARPGQPLRYVGEGHQIYSEPAGATANSSASSAGQTGTAATTARRPFPGQAGLAPASTLREGPSHFHPPHQRVPPIIVNPGYGTFGFGGVGFGSPFFGSPFYFGGPYFFGDPFFGFEFGSVFVPCNGFGAGLQCMPYNANYYNEQPFTSTMIGGTETETQSQEIFSPYSPAPPQPEENTNGPSPVEYVLYLKDGAIYVVNDYWYQDGKLVYSTATGQDSVDLDRIDMQKTLDVNAKRGLVFTLRPAPQAAPPDATSPDQNLPAQPNATPPQPDQQAQPNQTAPAPQP